MVFLQYMWSIIKVDLSKLLNANTKHAKVSKTVSVKIFSISDEMRDLYLNRYLSLCKDLHLVKFLDWRRRNRKFQVCAPKPRRFLEGEIPRYLVAIDEAERFLFKDLDAVIHDCINESLDMKSHRTKTSMVLKHLEHIKRTNTNRASFITLEEDHKEEDQFAEILEVEIPPEFVYMPTKMQMMTMIANAAYHNQK
jgi:hypothetical protein